MSSLSAIAFVLDNKIHKSAVCSKDQYKTFQQAITRIRDVNFVYKNLIQ